MSKENPFRRPEQNPHTNPNRQQPNPGYHPQTPKQNPGYQPQKQQGERK